MLYKSMMTASPSEIVSKRVGYSRQSGKILGLAGLAATAVGLILSRLGGVWIGFDLFAYFTVHLILAAAIFLAMALMSRASILFAAILAAGAVAAIGLWPQLTMDDAGKAVAAPNTGKPLRLMTFNTWLANKDGKSVAAEISRNDPDMAMLIEFGSEKRAALERLKRQYPYQRDCLDQNYCYLAFVSKYPIATFESRIMWRGPLMLKVGFGPELDGLTVFGIHAFRLPHMRTHYNQMVELANFVADTKGPVIVMGDFNSTPFSATLDAVQAHGLKRLTYLASWPAYFQLPQLAIDHIFVSEEIRAVSPPRIGKSSGSDHFPIVADVAIAKAMAKDQ